MSKQGFSRGTFGRKFVAHALAEMSAVVGPQHVRTLLEFRRAVQQDQLLLLFQPKAALASGRAIGVEALIRWRHPQRGLLAPAAFLSDVERSPLMRELTATVLQQAIAAQRLLEAAGHRLSIQVNLAGRDLLDPSLAARLEVLADAAEIDAHNFCVEVTENDLLCDIDRAVRTVDEVHAAGMQVSLDDFGTGYSSLARLRGMRVDEIKIDRSFIATMCSDPASASIVRAIIDLSHDLGTRVVAEGVENEAQHDALRRLGCDVVQGFYIARPMPMSDLTQWLTRRTASTPTERPTALPSITIPQVETRFSTISAPAARTVPEQQTVRLQASRLVSAHRAHSGRP